MWYDWFVKCGRLGHLMAEDGGCRWLLSTTAVPASVGDLGKKVEVDLGDYHVIGLYLLTSDEVRSATFFSAVVVVVVVVVVVMVFL